jgi:glutamate/tyrosine decarboxylase-like PLP-dependent enzyme
MNEETLDPEDWAATRALGRRMTEDALGWLEGVRERPVWTPIPAPVREFLAREAAAPPAGPTPPEALYEEYRRQILPHAMGNVHPRFWGWVIGTGSATGALAELLAATMNPNVGGGQQVPHELELVVLAWMKRLMGFPAEASGLLVSGGSMANLVGLTVARNAKAEIDVVTRGLAAAPRPMTLYASEQVHNSVTKGLALLGLGHDALRVVPVDAAWRIDRSALAARVAADRAAGMHPFCVVGTAGTVNTGAIDDLEAIADFCAAENLWFHCDGAFGAVPMLSPKLRPLVAGLARADSLAFDLHKWMHVPYEAGVALVRHPEAHHDSFRVPASYLTHATGGLAAAEVWLSEYGVQLSRGFRALKVWWLLREHGVDKYGRLVEQNCAQAAYLAALVDAEPELERMAPVELNIVCFRYRGAPGPLATPAAPSAPADDAALDRLNEALLVGLQEDGVAMPSSTELGGRFALRVCVTNHRSRREDFDLLVRETLARGRRLAATGVPVRAG